MQTPIRVFVAAPIRIQSRRCNAPKRGLAKPKAACGIRLRSSPPMVGPRLPTARQRALTPALTNLAGRQDGSDGRRSLPAADLTGFTPAQIAFARAAWPMRAAEELRSALIFRALARAAAVTNLPDPWPERFAGMVVDEVGHARLCAEVGAQLGAPAPRYDATPVRARLAALEEPMRRITALLLVEAAMGETVSTMLFHAGRRSTTEPLTRAALSAILADEVRHQRNGWTGIAALWPSLSGPQREALQREATQGFAGLEQQVAIPALRWLDAGEPFDPALAALGVLRPEERVDAFYHAIERLVVPRLTALGLDGSHAWHDRYRCT